MGLRRECAGRRIAKMNNEGSQFLNFRQLLLIYKFIRSRVIPKIQ